MELHLFKHWTYQIFSPGTVLRAKYEAFKALLEADRRSHELLAELEEIAHRPDHADFKFVGARYRQLAEGVAAMIESLVRMAPGSYGSLWDYYRKIDSCSRFLLTPPKPDCAPPFILDLAAVDADHHRLAGGKGLNLALVKNTLALPVPAGFVITTNAFNLFIEENGLQAAIDSRLSRLASTEAALVEAVSSELVGLIVDAVVPPALAAAIAGALATLAGGSPGYALRSSAVAEDSSLSFAGQYRTVLDVAPTDVLTAYKKVLASRYEPPALAYRMMHGLADHETPMAVVVLPMVAAQVSGVMFTASPDSDGPGRISIHSTAGRGGPLVGGEVAADRLSIAREGGEWRICRQATAPEARPMLSDAEALTLARWAGRLEEFFQEPQEVEWCLDADRNPVLLQSRPLPREQRQARPAPSVPPSLPLILAGGERACGGMASGVVFRPASPDRLAEVPAGAVLVTPTIPPAYARIIDRLRAVVADRGSAAGHFASVAREFGVPTLVNTGKATELLAAGQEVTVDADRLRVYAGAAASAGVPEGRADDLYRRRLRSLLTFVSPLRLVDPAGPEFVPEGCRSLHDIIRFVHEKGMAEMFAIGDRWSAKIKGARRLVSGLPMTVYVLDVGNGLVPQARHRSTVGIDEVRCAPMQALWQGLTHPGIDWSAHDHFDWKSFDAVVMAGGMASKKATAFASYAVISDRYLNLNLRFGYHFTILDAFVGERPGDNYITLRFAGGGGNYDGRARRVRVLAAVLTDIGFSVQHRGDLVDGRCSDLPRQEMDAALDQVGRLLGATRLLDMVLRDDATAEAWLAAFRQGRYRADSEGR